MDPDSGNPLKRQRLNDNGDSSGLASSSQSSSSFLNNVTGQGTHNKREVCRFGSSCYRRNETHLLQYRHRLLEDAFQQMKTSGDFSRIPDGFNLDDGDEAAILEQAQILKDAGFQTESQNVKTRISNTPANNAKDTENQIAKTSSEDAKTNDQLTNLFEERRRRMKEKEQALEKRKLEIKASGSLQNNTQNTAISSNRSTMASKWEASCPYNIFLTKVRDIPVEKDGVLSASFTDLFDPSFGEIKSVCHINFMIEANWLFEQSKLAGLEGKQTRIIYSDSDSQMEEAAKTFPWLKVFKVKSPFPYGHHHTKMTFVLYSDDSLRFFIYTANLIESDWDNRTQGIWISPKCPKVPSGSAPLYGESVTKFRNDIMEYLTTYSVQASGSWRNFIKYADCSAIKTYFVASAPITSQSHFDGFQFGIKKMEKILKSYELETEPSWPLIAQCSSIGTLGASANDWVINEFGAAMAGKDRSLQGPINLVYPTEQNVKTSFDGVLGGGCLPYSAMTHMKQRWLDRHLCQWKADCSGRSRAPPHIKSYSRWSPDQTQMAWFLLTSANLSKAAWGKLNKNGNRLTIMSWEAGVLFIPELITSTKYFKVNNPTSNEVSHKFPLYFDLPVVKYEKKDHPWFYEHLKLAISE